jgi:hypothetical protein
LLIAGVLLMLFLALPWLLVACRDAGAPGWLYGAEPLSGWLRLWALAPVWLLLGALGALAWAIRREAHD